jgi:hypothetical protein
MNFKLGDMITYDFDDIKDVVGIIYECIEDDDDQVIGYYFFTEDQYSSYHISISDPSDIKRVKSLDKNAFQLLQ